MYSLENFTFLMRACVACCATDEMYISPQSLQLGSRSLQRGSMNETANNPGRQRSSENVLAAHASALLGYLGSVRGP